ncbi:MAG: DUF5107 domain-containing protein [Hespellia sp.]|nr:DUF5107 domain-containing protein [Hespellia sp.]
MANELTFETLRLLTGTPGQEATVPAFLGNLTIQNEVHFALDETDEIFEAYGRTSSCFPYRELTTYDRKLTEQETEAAVLDDGHLRAIFLPAYGGRLWSLYDYDHERDLLYTNDVLRYSNLAVRNAWFSGGVEWNIGVIGHTPLTTEAMNVASLTTADGKDVLRMYNYERIRGLEYQMDFWLDSTGDDHYLTCRMRVVNSSQNTVPMYWWSNMAVPEYQGGRIVVPTEEAFTCKYTSSKSQVYKTAFPVPGNPDTSYYQNIKNQVDYFFNIAKDEPKYIANMDKHGYGLLHISTDRLRGRKLFTWGQNDASGRWQEFLTEDAGRYVEIQAGLAQTQYGCLPLAAHTAWEWAEQYSWVHVAESIRSQTYPEFHKLVTEKVRALISGRKLKDLLPATAPMARTMAAVHSHGKSYATLTNRIRHLTGEKPLSPHLKYDELTPELTGWLEFIKKGIFMTHSDLSFAPGDFQNDEIFYRKLKETIDEEKNRNNWYAHYQLGAMHLYREDYERAKASFTRAAELTAVPNPWTDHGFACIAWKTGCMDDMISYIKHGITARSCDLSYVKEGFRMLMTARQYGVILELYKKLSGDLKKEHRIHYDYLVASAHEHPEKQNDILMELETETFVLDDLREGDDAIGVFYAWLYQQVHGEMPPKILHHLNFNSLEPE